MRTGLRLRRKGSSARSSGGTRRGTTCAARGSRSRLVDHRQQPLKKPFASGESLAMATRVGESCLAAGTSWRISGSVLTENSRSRSRWSGSSRKVGKALNSASMSLFAGRRRLEDRFEFWIRSASSPLRPRKA